MLKISNKTADAFHNDGLLRLRKTILGRWENSLAETAKEVGAEGRESILTEIEALSRENTNATEAELKMLADLKLVDLANKARMPEA